MNLFAKKSFPGACALLFVLLLGASAARAADRVEVVVNGITGELLDNVRKALALPPGLVQNGVVNRLWLERFRNEAAGSVKLALEPYGYYDPQIRTALVHPAPDLDRLVVDVFPGPPVLISSLHVAVTGTGSSQEALRKLAADFPLRRGAVLVQPQYEKAKAGLLNRATDLGYLGAHFTAHTIAVDPGRRTASVNLVLDTGPRYYFGAVRFEGAPGYPEKFLRRFVAFKPGGVFSYTKLGETQLNLLNSQRFTQAVPVPEKELAENQRVPVLFRLTQAPTKHLRPGVGYGTDIGPRFTLDYSDLNVFSRGHEFRTGLNLSPVLQSAGSSYVIPGENIKTTTGFLLNFRHEDTSTYTLRNFTLEADRNLSFGRGRLGTAYLRFERERSTVAYEPLDSRLVLPGVRFSEQRYNSLLRPTEGHQYSIDLRGTHQAIGSNNRFLQAVFDGNLLVPLPWRLSLYTRLKAGVTFQNAPVTTLPVSYRFFAGGDRSVRGYSYQSLGPKDLYGNVIGGRDTLVGSIELDRALFTNWGVAVFYDAGNAFNSLSAISLAQGAGIGVRYYTIVGALRLDLARQIGVTSPSYRVHFTVGFAF